MKNVFPAEWRTQVRWKRRFYARYMRSLERAGYVLVALVFAAFIAAFNTKVEDLVTADKVAIVPFAQPLEAVARTRVVRVLAKDLDIVRAGQPLLEIVSGDDAIRRYDAWAASQTLSASEPTLAGRYPKPPTTVLNALSAGTFRLDAKEGATIDDKASLGRVVDYDDLRMEASLTGDTVAKAMPDNVARIVNIAVDPLAGTLFRGGGAVSGRLLGEGVKATLEKSLVGRDVALRDDVPLRVKSISEVQVDADVSPQGGSGGSSVALDPPADLRIEARVVEGSPSATVQVADLPSATAAAAREAVADALRGRSVSRPDGSLATFSNPRDIRMVVKLKAGPGGKGADAIPGTMLARSFDVKLKLVSPPRFLVNAVREADAAGKAVTARVELRTGERPIALRLLKKS